MAEINNETNNPEGGNVQSEDSGTDIQAVNWYKEGIKLLEYAESRIIKTLDDAKIANDDLTIISRLKKAMEERRKELLKPYQDEVKAINDNYKFWMQPILYADQITRDKILGFNREQERIKREQEEINRKRMEAAEAEMRLKGELSEPVNLVEVIEAPTKVSTEMGTSGMRDNWKYRVVNFAELPDEYKIEDSTMLNAIAKKHHDTKKIPGVEFYNEPIIAVRTK